MSLERNTLFNIKCFFIELHNKALRANNNNDVPQEKATKNISRQKPDSRSSKELKELLQEAQRAFQNRKSEQWRK